MAQEAPGLAKILSDLSAQNFRFGAFTDSITIISNEINTISGTWTRSGNTITWSGTDPQMQNTSGSSIDVVGLRVGDNDGVGGGNLIAAINHTDVPLANNDTIVYTSIQISFTTDDIT